LNNNDLTKNIKLCTKLGTGDMLSIPTNFQREEAYLIEHCIHHFALIRIGIQESFPDVFIDKNFGVAHSTIEFRQKEKERCSAR
jgi:hypothetical protein